MNDTATLSRLFSDIQGDLDLVDRTFQERAASGLDILNAAAMHALSSRGKRLRTALTLLSGKLNNYRLDKLLPLSVAFEMLHLATLIHDDIVDGSHTRRGIPTVNARWGDSLALLLGDYFFAKTAGLIADVEDFRIDRLFSDTVASVCEGTIIELMSSGTLDLSVDVYYEKTRRKTACLMAACCKGGATVSGASDAQIALLHQYGLNLGMAFQIIDDILDYTGSEESIGKPAGNDLRQGMVTLPLIYALQAEQNGRSEMIRQILQNPHPPAEEINQIIAWVAASPAIEQALADARHYANRARATLRELRPSPYRAVLEELVDFVINRQK
jgi:geranylgeranyl pyrophosphate synthase